MRARRTTTRHAKKAGHQSLNRRRSPSHQTHIFCTDKNSLKQSSSTKKNTQNLRSTFPPRKKKTSCWLPAVNTIPKDGGRLIAPIYKRHTSICAGSECRCLDINRQVYGTQTEKESDRSKKKSPEYVTYVRTGDVQVCSPCVPLRRIPRLHCFNKKRITAHCIVHEYSKTQNRA